MFTIGNNGEFSIYMPTPEDKVYAEKLIAEAKESNRKYLLEKDIPMPRMPITGSFIYAHPPNYAGRPAINYSKKDWMGLFDELIAAGMDTVIFQAALWYDLKECYYPSEAFKDFKTWNVLQPMLEAASEKKLNVFLGGFGSATGWKEDPDSETIEKEHINQMTCFRELHKAYKGLFHGVYFAPETAFQGKRNNKREKGLNCLYKRLFSDIKSEFGNVRILMSPATKYYEGMDNDILESWLNLLSDVPLDLLAPQDSVGTCGNQLRYQDKCFQLWKRICDETDIGLWSNVEVFERKDKIEGFQFNIAPDFKRVSAQINSAVPYVKKLICWEAPYYLSSHCGKAGLELKEKLKMISMNQ